MKTKVCFLLGYAVAAALSAIPFSPAVKAQNQNQFKQNFINNVVKGCKQRKSTVSQSQQHAFCVCYANSFVKRYSDEELGLIVRSLPRDPKEGSKITQAFMMPEIKTCTR